MRHLDLFAGVGGFSLAARMVGWKTVAWCEIDTFCQQVLTKHFPDAKQHTDIKELDGTQYRGTVDIITGGFPCQPFSKSGNQRGTEDPRHLWPEMLRVIREVAPRWVVGENVLGLVNWNGGMVFEQVHTDLENAGYQVTAYILPACSIGAPHERTRVWFVAHTNEVRIPMFETTLHNQKRNDTGKRQEREILDAFSIGYGENGPFTWWTTWPTKPGVCRGDDGVPNRMDRIGALGNAIVPQIAVQIFKSIQLHL